MKSLFLLLFTFLFTVKVTVAQEENKFSVTAGIGLYELTNMGLQWNYGRISSLSVFGGSNFGYSNSTRWSAGMSFDQVWQKPIVWDLKLGYSLGVIYWTNNDHLYYFNNLSLPIMALLSYPITHQLSIHAESGVLLNKVLSSERKQNVAIGFPQRTNGNFRFTLVYNIPRK